MRQFVVLGHEAPTEPDFSLDDLPGAGRLDVLCRCVADAFLLSHDLREDVRLFLVFRDELVLRFEGAELRYLSPDERNVASLIRAGIEATEEAVGSMEAEGTPGVYASKRGFEGVVTDLAGPVIQLHGDGEPIVDLAFSEDPAFVLSDHRDFTDAEADRLAEIADRRASLGPNALHADQAITIAHNYLDTGGFAEY